VRFERRIFGGKPGLTLPAAPRKVEFWLLKSPREILTYASLDENDNQAIRELEQWGMLE